VLDEPTTGLHFSDIELLTHALFGLRDAGNSVLIIEHNIDLIACADWVVDMGPEGGEHGGLIVASGTPEEIAANTSSHTGRYLKLALAAHRGPARATGAKTAPPERKAAARRRS
jgi:excinuclease ABC subunit A